MSIQRWSFFVGRRGVNRVRVYQRAGWQIRMLVQGKDFCLGHRDRELAIRQAREKSAEIHQPRHVRKHANIMRVRQDLLRVARELGLPPDVAPPFNAYKRLGAFGEGFVQGQHVGYQKAGGTKEQWCDTVRRYGLKPYRDACWSPGTPGKISADIKRVAMLTGKAMRMPTTLEYAKHGKWARDTALRWHGAKNWTELARMLGLSMAGRKANQHTARVTLEQKKSAA